jgi:hypothetical protein
MTGLGWPGLAVPKAGEALEIPFSNQIVAGCPTEEQRQAPLVGACVLPDPWPKQVATQRAAHPKGNADSSPYSPQRACKQTQ